MSASEGGMKLRVVVLDGEAAAAEKSAAKEKLCEYTLDGSVDIKGQPAVKGKSGGWLAGGLILGLYGAEEMEAIRSGAEQMASKAMEISKQADRARTDAGDQMVPDPRETQVLMITNG